jgi:PAS domain S-box-containing protein
MCDRAFAQEGLCVVERRAKRGVCHGLASCFSVWCFFVCHAVREARVQNVQLTMDGYVAVPGLSFTLRNRTSVPWKRLTLQFEIDARCNGEPKHWSRTVDTFLGSVEDDPAAQNIPGSWSLPRALPGSEEEYGKLWATIPSGEWRGTFHNKKKNGELFWEAASIRPILDASGKPAHYLAVKVDITARKLAEDKIAWLASFPEQNPNPVVEIEVPSGVCYGATGNNSPGYVTRKPWIWSGNGLPIMNRILSGVLTRKDLAKHRKGRREHFR